MISSFSFIFLVNPHLRIIFHGLLDRVEGRERKRETIDWLPPALLRTGLGIKPAA